MQQTTIRLYKTLVLAVASIGLFNCTAETENISEVSPAFATQSEKQIETTSNGCTIERYRIPSPSMGRSIRIAVVLPPEYAANPDKHYPILYTLHGMDAPYDTFAKMSRLHAQLKDKPFIYTCLDADKSGWYIDSTLKQDSQFETFFFDEFMPYLDANYRTSSKRGLVGFSMGGFGAMYYALQRPHLFQSVCALSGGFHHYSNIQNQAEIQGVRLEALLGPYAQNRAQYAAMDVFKLLEKNVANKTHLPVMNIRCGTEDFLLKQNRDFLDALVEQNGIIRGRIADSITDEPDAKAKAKRVARQMTTEGINFSYVEQPGAHNWAYWHAQAPEFARFFYDSVH